MRKPKTLETLSDKARCCTRKPWFAARAVTLAALATASLDAQNLALDRTRIWSQDVPGIEGDFDPLDEFGAAIAVGDITGGANAELVVGSPNDEVPGVAGRPGTINIIVRDAQGNVIGGQLLHQDSLGTPGVAEDGDRFGASLAIGDFDCDLLADIAVGAPGESLGVVAEAGAVNVFYGNGNQQLWSQESAGIGGFAEVGDQFGHSLTAHDFDLDGCDDLVVGAPGEDLGSDVDVGVAHVLYGLPFDGLSAGGSVLLSSPEMDPEDEFGSSLEVFNYRHLAIGAPGAQAERGSVLIFAYSWVTHQFDTGFVYNPLPDPNIQYRLGAALALSVEPTVGLTSLFAGAPGKVLDPAHRGLVVDADAATLLEPATAFYDFFGRALASGNFHADTEWDLAVSSVRSTDGNGVVHLRLPSAVPAAVDQILDSVPGRAPNPDFGAVLASGDLDDDGVDELLIWDRDAVLEIPGMQPFVFGDVFEIGNTTAWSSSFP